MRLNDSALGVDLKARPDSSAVEHLTYKVRGRELEPRSGRLIFVDSLQMFSKNFASSIESFLKSICYNVLIFLSFIRRLTREGRKELLQFAPKTWLHCTFFHAKFVAVL